MEVTADIVGGDFEEPAWDRIEARTATDYVLFDRVVVYPDPRHQHLINQPVTIEAAIEIDGHMTGIWEALAEEVLVPDVGVFYPVYGSFDAQAAFQAKLVVEFEGTETELYNVIEGGILPEPSAEDFSNGFNSRVTPYSPEPIDTGFRIQGKYGQPIEFSLVFSFISDVLVTAQDGGKPRVNVATDYQNTFDSLSLTILDEFDNIDDTATLESEGGFEWLSAAPGTHFPPLVPEPDSLVLLALSLPLLCRRYR